MEDTPEVVGSVDIDDVTRDVLVNYSQEQHDQLEATLVRLMHTYNLEGACVWLVGANKLLHGQRPIDIIAGNDQAAKARLDNLIESLEAGNF